MRCAEPPRILHYGLLWEVKNHYYMFDKAWYHDFDPLQCPPWNLTDERPSAGLFPLPPRPSAFKHYTVGHTAMSNHTSSCSPVHLCMHVAGGRVWLDQQTCCKGKVIPTHLLSGRHKIARGTGWDMCAGTSPAEAAAGD